MRFLVTLIVLVIALSDFHCLAADAPLAGKYSDGTVTAELTQSAGAYAGTITLGNQQFPTVAHSNRGALDGTFTAGGNTFAFTAALEGDTLTLSTGGKSYALKRVGRANPLAKSAPGADDPPAGYSVEAATEYGKSLVAQKPNANSVKSALESTFPDLARYFGARPTIGSAYQDAKDPKSGGATFGANLGGHPVRGFVSCKLHDGGGATVAVIFGRTDASKAEWDKLLSPAPPNGAASPATADPAIPLRSYEFPDGSGSVGLADGWDTKAQTCIHPAVLIGPVDQFVILGNSLLVQSPDSMAVRTMQQNEQMMKQMEERNRRMGLRSAPMPQVPPMLVAPLTDPVDALRNLAPQFSKRSEFNHGPSYSLDRIISSQEVPTQLKDGKGAIISYTMTRTLEGKSTPYRVQLHLQVCPITSEAWMWFATSMQAPDSSFDRDLPIMSAMVNSLKINQERARQLSDAENERTRQMTAQMAQQSQQNLEANARQFQRDQERRYQIGQAQHAAQMEGYARHNEQWKSDELQKSRNAADFIETIKGTRTVYDTQTGATGTADLNYVNGVVDSLNKAALDPNRYIQIPLRDEMYPVPPGK